MKRLVLLDFDGTIYNGDSLLDFAKMINSTRYYFSMGIIAFMLPLIWLSDSNRDLLKRQFLRINFKGKSRSFLEQQGRLFFEQNIQKCYPKALEWLKNLDRTNTTVVILSASCAEWLGSYAKVWGTELLCTVLEYDEQNLCTGNWKGNNIRGINKVIAVKQVYNLENYDEIIAFGNERADLMLREVADSVELNHFQ